MGVIRDGENVVGGAMLQGRPVAAPIRRTSDQLVGQRNTSVKFRVATQAAECLRHGPPGPG
jgi:hypothetical protein